MFLYIDEPITWGGGGVVNLWGGKPGCGFNWDSKNWQKVIGPVAMEKLRISFIMRKELIKFLERDVSED